jgi:hypothetical protein
LFLSRGVANIEAIKELPALPETAEELKSVARLLGSPDTDLLLGPDANERELRKRPLNDYRVISFATHAIVAGEIEGVTEPALVLSPINDAAHPGNDGLLTASKVANLPLDANLVILSACNTAASDGHASGRGLSGLANAFFFAGARSVAVTQWSVLSSAAQEIGAGLVERSVRAGSQGVSKGLQEAMLNYIESAKEDYLANPRFWAAFIIAGDGAVSPLDGAASDGVDHDLINLEWQRTMPNPGDADALSIVANDNVFYSSGIEKPLLGEKVAGSYLAWFTENTEINNVIRDASISGARLAWLGDKLGEFGYYPHNNNTTSAVFRLLDAQGNLQWQHVEDSSMSIFPLNMLKTSRGYILLSVEVDYSPKAQPSFLDVTLIPELDGGVLQKRYAVNVRPQNLFSRMAVAGVEQNGSLVVAIGGTALTLNQQNRWINPLTGTIRICSAIEQTQILRLSGQTLDLENSENLNSFSIVSLQSSQGHLYASGQFSKNCRSEKGIVFGELGSDFGFRKIFESKNVNSLELRDMVVESDGVFLLAGTTRIFIPSAVTMKIVSAGQIFNWNDEFYWENSESRGAAFVLALRKDGSVLGDRVFTDLRARGISALITNPAGALVAGNAFGDRGWIAGLRIPKDLWRDAPSVANRH